MKRAESGAVKIRGATYATSAYGHGGGGGGDGGVSSIGGGSSASSSSSIQVKVEPSSSSAIVKPDKHARGRFVMPAVGANGAQSGFLNGKTVVITGIFPEVGGGAGLNLGKDKLKVRNITVHALRFVFNRSLFHLNRLALVSALAESL